MKIIVLLLIISIGFKSYGTNYYVSSKKGNFRYNGLSPSKPKAQIQEAANLTKPGDTVFVMDGVYRNNCQSCNVVDITRSGTQYKNIVFTNFKKQHPVISFNGWAGIAIGKGASYLQINGFDVVGNNSKINLVQAYHQPGSCENKGGTIEAKYNGNGIVISAYANKHSHHILISKNTVHDCGGAGIGAASADYIIFEDNLVYNTSWYSVFGTSGISFYEFWNFDDLAEYHNIIRRNRCFNNKSFVPCIKVCSITDGNGIIIDDFRNWQNVRKKEKYRSRTLVENNICWYNGGTAIHSFQSDHVDIINNTAFCNSKSKELKVGEILAGGSSDVRIVNNIIVVDSLNVINSDYLNSNIVYQNNLHFNKTYPQNTTAIVSNSTCVIGKDPEFVLPIYSLKADFRLKANSPAIGYGNETLFSKKDFNAVLRPIGKKVDIGAFKY